jgi:hypothetical protein
MISLLGHAYAGGRFNAHAGKVECFINNTKSILFTKISIIRPSLHADVLNAKGHIKVHIVVKIVSNSVPRIFALSKIVSPLFWTLDLTFADRKFIFDKEIDTR